LTSPADQRAILAAVAATPRSARVGGGSAASVPDVGLEELLWAGADAQARALEAGELSAPELLAAVLRRIEAVQPAINAFRVVCADQAERDAAQAQRRLAAGERAPLLGVPIAVKDDTDLAGFTTCQGADPGPRRPAARDSEVVQRLRAAGAVIVGKTHVPELTIWPFTESMHHGATRNPWALDRAPGGSSGGSAAAVAAGVVGVAHGSDGAGSIRIPASWCAVVGLKPTRGLVPIAPMPHDWYRMVHFGPLSRDVASAARFLDACAPAGDGQGYLDALAQPLPPLRIAVSRRCPPGSLPALRQAERAAFERAAALLREAGHHVRELDPTVPVTAAAQVLARYLRGVHDTGRGVPPGSRLEPRTRGMVRLGGLVPPSLLRASLRGEQALARRVLAIFDEVDVVLQPGPSSPPSVIGGYARAGALRTLGAAITKVPFLPLWNLVGNPVLAAPVTGGRAVEHDDGQNAGSGTARSAAGASLPAGVQLVGPPGGERTLLRLALQLEQATGWATRRPAALPR
jgi:amidase